MTLGPGYFDEQYAASPDPWGFDTRWYEQRKRALTLAALPSWRYAHAFEPGCSLGVLTADLAARCDRLLATDTSERAVALARARLAGHPGVRVERLAVPHEWPETGPFDLIVLSEIGYYLDDADLSGLVGRTAASLTADGVVLACHWRHSVADYPVPGDAVHERLRSHPGLAVLASHVEADFLLDVLVVPPVVSVAAREGLA